MDVSEAVKQRHSVRPHCATAPQHQAFINSAARLTDLTILT